MLIDRLIDAIKVKKNPTIVGLDTDFDYLPTQLKDGVNSLEGVRDAIIEFNKNILDSVYDLVPAVKVQVAYYEMYGVPGMQAFEETLKYAKSLGLITVADVKRNDIGSTAACYSKAYLSGVNINGYNVVPFDSDFITVNGYLGGDGIKPFIKDCIERDKGLFILVKTSNPTSGELQNQFFDSGKMLYEEMGDLVATWGETTLGKYGYSNIGAVVGATHKEEADNLRKRLPSVFFLIPGYGAQGGKSADLAVSFKNGIGGIVNNSRGILTAYKQEKYSGQTYQEAARNAVIDMAKDLMSAIEV